MENKIRCRTKSKIKYTKGKEKKNKKYEKIPNANVTLLVVIPIFIILKKFFYFQLFHPFWNSYCCSIYVYESSWTSFVQIFRFTASVLFFCSCALCIQCATSCIVVTFPTFSSFLLRFLCLSSVQRQYKCLANDIMIRLLFYIQIRQSN